MSLLGCLVQHIQFEVESTKHECFFVNSHANVASHKVASVNEEVQLSFANGLAMVKKPPAEMIYILATMTRKALL